MPTLNKQIRQLRKILNDHFSMGDLHLIAYDLGIDSDNLNGNTKVEKIHDLIIVLQRQGRIPELIVLVQEERPQLSLPDFYQEQTEVPEKFVGQTEKPPILQKKIPASKPGLAISAAGYFYFARGINHFSKNRCEKAIIDFTYAINLQPTLAVAYWERGLALQKQLKLEEAIADFDIAIQLKPDNVEYLRTRGKAYLKLGKTEELFEDLFKVLSINPNDSQALNSICWNGSLSGQAEEVKIYCEQAVKTAPATKKPLYQDSRGVNRALLGRFESAIEDFESFLNYLKDKPEYAGYITSRKMWINALQKGENPFDESTIELLKMENSF